MPRTRTRKRFIKKIIFASVSAVIIIALVVCAVIFIQNGKYNPDKFNKTTVTAMGGEDVENVNLTKINYSYPQDGQTEITLFFTDLSNNELTGIPKYSVSFFDAPARLKITLSGITCWDYVVLGIDNDNNGIISGMFQQSPGGDNKDTSIYFNLNKDVKFKVKENDDKSLSVILEDAGTDKNKTGTYLVCDLFYEYQEGSIPDDSFTPTLSNDGVSVVLVSQMYSSQDDAEKARNALLEDKYKDQNIVTVEADRFSLLSLTDNSDTLSLLNESVLSVDGAKTTLPLFCSDARFLCWMPDGNGALFAKTEDEGETLYTADRTGTKHKIIDNSFSTIVKAVYSSDGTKLAFIEHTDEAELATVMDIKNQTLKVIGSTEDGNILGNLVFGIALDEDGTNLFAISGDENYSLFKCNTVTDEITALKSEMITESDVFYNAGCLFYCDVVDEMEVVVRHDVETNNCDVIGKGAQFSVSDDGNFVAVLSEDYDTAVYDLVLFNTVENEQITVVHDVVCSEFFISGNADYIYYVIETGDPEFYYQIMRYDIESKEISSMAQCVNAVFFASKRPNEVIISVNYTEEEQVHPVTFIADFDKINETVQSEIPQTE